MAAQYSLPPINSILAVTTWIPTNKMSATIVAVSFPQICSVPRTQDRQSTCACAHAAGKSEFLKNHRIQHRWLQVHSPPKQMRCSVTLTMNREAIKVAKHAASNVSKGICQSNIRHSRHIVVEGCGVVDTPTSSRLFASLTPSW